MVYYMKAMAEGLAKKVALPIAFAATALTPAMAETTLKIGEDFQKIAYDQTKTVSLVMTSENDNLSFVELDVYLPEGLDYIEGSFKKAAIPALKDHLYKVNPIDGGFHVLIYNDNLISMGDMDNQVIATFDVKANTKLSGESGIGLEIIDLVDENGEQVKYKNVGLGGEEGSYVNPDGDNSIGSQTIAIDKGILPGEWNVYVTSENLADGVLTIDPTKGLFTPQTLTVNLKNTEALVGGISFRLILPQGLTLLTETVKLNTERTGEKSVSYSVIKEGGIETNDYVIFLSGDTKALNLTDGAVITFDVQADVTLAKTALDAVNPTFKDDVVLNEITVTDIYGTDVKQENIVIKAYNKNEEAYWTLMNTVTGDKRGILTLVEDDAALETKTRVYDYWKVKDARNAANDYIDNAHTNGVLAVDDNFAQAKKNISDYAQAITDADLANEAAKKEHEANVAQQKTDLEAAIPEEVTSFPAAPAVDEGLARRAMEPIAVGETPLIDWTDLTVEDFIDPTVATTYQAAVDAIAAYENKIAELYNQKELENAERYDGALLADLEQETSQIKALQKAANDAIQAFVDKLDEVNKANKQKFENLANGELTNLFNNVVKYVEELENTETGTKKGAYADEKNFPEILEAIADAKELLDALLDKSQDLESAIINGYNAGLLPFEEGIQPVLDAIQGENGIIEALQKIKDLADDAKKKNDDAFVAENNEYILGDDAKIYDPALYYGDFTGFNLEDQPETYQAAWENAQEAINKYVDELGKSNEKGMVYKDLNNADSNLAKAKAALDQALDEVKTVVENLTAVNNKVTEADQNLEDAENKLKEIREDEKYKYIDSSEKTAALMDAIDDKIAKLHERINDINDDANKGKDDWKELLNENGEVDTWLAELKKIIDEIEGTIDAEGNPVDGLDQDIEKAVETYDKFHKRGDANLDGYVSMLDYNIIMQNVREELDVDSTVKQYMRADKTSTAEVTEEEYNEQLSQLNVVQEKAFGEFIEVNITDAVGALNIYLNDGSDEGLGLGDRYYNARATEAESLMASETMVGGVRRIALNLNNVMDYTAAQLDLVLPEGATLVAANLGERSNGHDLFVGSVKDGRQRLVISNDRLNAFKGNEGAVLYIDVQGDGDVQFNNVIFSTTKAQSTRFTVGAAAETTGIAGVKAAAEGEQVYSIGGRLMNAVKKGINIIRRADGTTQKVIKK